MKITHIPSGKPYQLAPDTQLTVERTNPFFNDYGEQTIPVSLPDSEYNRSLLDYPGSIQRKEKVAMIDASIQDGEYYNVCRQAILSISPKEGIETSFYINDGSFYSRLDETYLTDIFSGETVENVSTLEEGISFMKKLFETGGNNMFSAFQVKIVSDSAKESRYLNGNNFRTGEFYNEKDTYEVVSGKNIHVPKGFYLTPFLKVNYVLDRVFSHFGYKLKENFFTRTAPFPDMVLINNIADALVTGVIHIDQLVPKITCSSFLDVIRKKFHAEFVVDEINKTADIILFNDLANSKPTVFLSDSLVDSISVKIPESYKCLTLESETVLDSENSIDSIPLMVSKYPTAQFDPKTGKFYRKGFALSNNHILMEYEEILAGHGQKYYENGTLETEEVKIPECIPGLDMYIGDVQFLNSSLMVEGASAENTDTTSETTDDVTMYTMLAFAYKAPDWKVIEGSVTGYISNYIPFEGLLQVDFSEYALIYNGEKGIFEKFYRSYDNLLRNSLHEVSANFLLTAKQKQDISANSVVEINGAKMIFNKLSYTLGDKNKISESELYTLNIYEPASYAKHLNEMLNDISSNYRWVPKTQTTEISEEEYNNSPYKDVVIAPFFPDVPKQEYLGKKYFERYEAYSGSSPQGVPKWFFNHVWLEVEAV